MVGPASRRPPAIPELPGRLPCAPPSLQEVISALGDAAGEGEPEEGGKKKKEKKVRLHSLSPCVEGTQLWVGCSCTFLWGGEAG